MELTYVSPPEAFEEASRRLRNLSLQNKIGTYLGNIWPRGFEEVAQPVAVFAPYLARGSQLEVAFAKDAAGQGFTPVIATYEQAKYVTANPGLVDCYRAPLLLPKGQRTREWVVPENQRAGGVGAACTKYPGLSIVNYWGGIREAILDDQSLSNPSVVDFSDWYQVQAERFGWEGGPNKSPFYYRALMGLYASGRAVLYDTPPTDFAKNVMAPAAQMVMETVGVEPLVTSEYQPGKRDWADLSFLSEAAYATLKETGRIGL